MDGRLRAKRASNELQMHSKHQNKGKGIVGNRFGTASARRSWSDPVAPFLESFDSFDLGYWRTMGSSIALGWP